MFLLLSNLRKMNFFRFILKRFQKKDGLTILATVSAGIFNGLLLLCINNALEVMAETQTFPNFFFFGFIISMILFTFAKRYSLFQSSAFFERVMMELRLSIVEKIRKSDYQKFEKIKIEINIYF